MAVVVIKRGNRIYSLVLGDKDYIVADEKEARITVYRDTVYRDYVKGPYPEKVIDNVYMYDLYDHGIRILHQTFKNADRDINDKQPDHIKDM